MEMVGLSILFGGFYGFKKGLFMRICAIHGHSGEYLRRQKSISMAGLPGRMMAQRELSGPTPGGDEPNS
jgi:hypothetical protein